MAQRTCKAYGLGWSTNPSVVPSITVEFNGQQVFAGAVQSHRVMEPVALSALADTDVPPKGDAIFSFQFETLPAGQYPLKVVVSGGALTLGNLVFNYYKTMELDTSPEARALVPDELRNRAEVNNITEAEMNWILNTVPLVPATTGEEFYEIHPGDVKKSPKINGVTVVADQPLTGFEPPWQWLLNDGDTFECMLEVPEEQRFQ